MIFDSNRAWQEAVAAASVSRSVLLPVAGVFFLVPAVATSFFLGDIQAAMMANLGNQEMLNGMIQAEMGKIMGISLAALVVQMAGYLAVLTLLTDRQRPTVGEAIGQGIRTLPTAIVALIVAYIGAMLLVMILAVAGGILTAMLGTAGAFVMVLGILAAMVWLVVRLSLILPVIVVEAQMNPIAALVRSWRLTQGKAMRLFGFYALLFIGYLVIAIIAMVFVGLIAGVAGGTASKGALIVTGIVSGALGAVIAVLACAVLAAIHRQLSGDGAAAVSDTFA